MRHSIEWSKPYQNVYHMESKEKKLLDGFLCGRENI